MLKAKENVIKYYAVVGTIERFDLFLEVLQKVLPQYFEGIAVRHNPQNRRNAAKKPTPLSQKYRNRLRKLMALEYEFYHFLDDRLLKLNDTLHSLKLP